MTTDPKAARERVERAIKTTLPKHEGVAAVGIADLRYLLRVEERARALNELRRNNRALNDCVEPFDEFWALDAALRGEE